MGLLFSRIVRALSSLGDQSARILMLGLGEAGKTTILYKLKLNEIVSTTPTIGFNIEKVTTPEKNVKLTIWDGGGEEQNRRLWKHYFQGTDGLLFVVDTSDPARFQEAQQVLENILLHEDMTQLCPLVILANKQDMPNAQPAHVLIDQLGLKSMKNPWYIQQTCAVTGEGLNEGVQQMAKMVKEFQNSRRR